jgi:hypothetical protein
MLPLYFATEPLPDPGWDPLQHGVPTVAGLARLCGAALARLDIPPVAAGSFSPEACAILALAGGVGLIELRGNKNAFEPADRLLAVCVIQDADQRIVFRDRSQPRRTMAFVEGFRQLCAAGLVLHHLMFDFSLTEPGFALADTLDPRTYRELAEFASREPI